ncbi:MAG TPA: multiple monosaccharide ABC transporter permease [Chthoniobacterales bacterium]
MSIAATTAPAVKAEKSSSAQNRFREYGLMIALIVIMVLFQILTNGTLFKPLNLTNLVLQNSYIIVMALGMLLVIVAGHIDLSVGSVAGFIGALAAVLMVTHKMNFVLATVLCLIAGGIIGAMQGYWIAYLKIPSFIVTLAGMLVFRGLTLALLGGSSIGPFTKQFQSLSSGFIPDFFATTGFRTTSMIIGVAVALFIFISNLRTRINREKHGYEGGSFVFFLLENLFIAGLFIYLSYLLASYKGIPNVLIVLGILVALFTFVTMRTTIGRRIYALGGNEKAARLSGIKTERLTFLTFVTMGALAALGGLIFVARLNTATPKAGVGFELDVIAAVFIGGASASGGVGKVMGAVIGAFIMGVMNNGMSIMGIGIDWQQVIKGLVLLAAVVFDVYSKSKG